MQIPNRLGVSSGWAHFGNGTTVGGCDTLERNFVAGWNDECSHPADSLL